MVGPLVLSPKATVVSSPRYIDPEHVKGFSRIGAVVVLLALILALAARILAGCLYSFNLWNLAVHIFQPTSIAIEPRDG